MKKNKYIDEQLNFQFDYDFSSNKLNDSQKTKIFQLNEFRVQKNNELFYSTIDTLIKHLHN